MNQMSPIERIQTGKELERCPFPIPYGWFMIEESANLAVGEVRTIHLFDQDWVLFRGESGAVVSALGITLPSSHAGDSSLVARLSKIACAAAGELSQLLDHVVALPSPDISRMHERKQ